MTTHQIGVIGAGAWGTALAQHAARLGHGVKLWARTAEVAAAIQQQRENPYYLPGIPLANGIVATTDLAPVVASDLLLLVVPTQFLATILAGIAPLVPAGTPLIVCAKGIERETLRLPAAIAADLIPSLPVLVLSGPSFAAELARGLPTAVSLAGTDEPLLCRAQEILSGNGFRPYRCADPVGVQIGGALKNVLAVACGISDGLGLGDNARAALLTRGLGEMARLAERLGGARTTLMGLAGLGDLVLTCTSVQSRNYTLGRALGSGRALPAILAERRSVAEGVATSSAAAALAIRAGLELPIIASMAAILTDGAPLRAALDGLLARPVTTEW